MIGSADLLERARAGRAFSGAAYVVGRHDRILEHGTLGTLAWDGDDVQADSLWDLASLTKPITALGVMVLLDRGELRLDDTLGALVPECAATDSSALTVRQLLTHTSGIPGQQPLYWSTRNSHEMLAAVIRLPLRFQPGSDVEYTSQGFMLLGRLVEVVAGMSLDAFVADAVLRPTGMEKTLFNPPPELLPRIAATEVCPWRGQLVRGQVHDENAVVMGGVAGHAGLFGTSLDLALLCQMMLSRGDGRHRRVLSPAGAELMVRPATRGLRLARCLGWQGRDATSSPAGDLFSERSYGHTGFTGTSVWLDPALDLFAVLLTNRVHPSRDNAAIQRVRPLFHNAVVAAWSSVAVGRTGTP